MSLISAPFKFLLPEFYWGNSICEIQFYILNFCRNSLQWCIGICHLCSHLGWHDANSFSVSEGQSNLDFPCLIRLSIYFMKSIEKKFNFLFLIMLSLSIYSPCLTQYVRTFWIGNNEIINIKFICTIRTLIYTFSLLWKGCNNHYHVRDVLNFLFY